MCVRCVCVCEVCLLPYRFSLTLIDSLDTLAVSGGGHENKGRRRRKRRNRDGEGREEGRFGL